MSNKNFEKKIEIGLIIFFGTFAIIMGIINVIAIHNLISNNYNNEYNTNTYNDNYDITVDSELNKPYTIEIVAYDNSSTKSYMDYRCITNTSSKQWDYIYNSGEVIVCDDGFIRTSDGQDYFGVALGSYFGEIGSKYIFTLDTGVELKVVKLDEKADKDTCENNFKHKIDGSVIEFVVDSSKMDYAKGSNGYIYNGNFNNNQWLQGNIVKIEKVIAN